MSKHLTSLRVLPATPPSDLSLAFDAFVLDCEARRLTPKTLEFYHSQLGPFIEHLRAQNVLRLDQITATHIRTWLIELQHRGLTDNTQHASARAIKTWLNFCVREELLEATPMTKVRMPRLNKEILPAFSPDHIRSLLGACLTPRDNAMVLCLLDTGCRASEFVALNVDDVDMKSGAVMVHQGKGRKDRVTFLGAKARKALLKYLMTRGQPKPDEPLWDSSMTGDRLTKNGLTQMLRRLGRRAQVEHCHPHTFRRTCALWSLRNGMDIFSLQQLMGHSDLTVLRRYLALVKDDLADAHKKHGPADNML